MNKRLDQTIWIGYDSRETVSFAIARYSIRRHQSHTPITGLVLSDLQKRGLYYRPTRSKINSDGKPQLWDVISDAPMATEFSNSRFLVPHLAGSGWALFVDSDVMVLENISNLFACARDDKAVMCVKHEDYTPHGDFKMDGQIQTKYSRKNWSSVMLFNCDHPANKRLTVEMINSVPGRHLHRFCWLEDEEIGELPPKWNYLVGYSKLNVKPALIHFTEGVPDLPGYENQEYADKWRDMKPHAVGAL